MQLIAPIGKHGSLFRLRNKTNIYLLWKQVSKVVDQFWSKWNRLYLAELSIKAILQKGHNYRLKKGDRVLVKSTQGWSSGLVENTFTGKDGQVRRVLIKDGYGNYQLKEIRQLSLLESNPALNSSSFTSG